MTGTWEYPIDNGPDPDNPEGSDQWNAFVDQYLEEHGLGDPALGFEQPSMSEMVDAQSWADEQFVTEPTELNDLNDFSTDELGRMLDLIKSGRSRELGPTSQRQEEQDERLLKFFEAEYEKRLKYNNWLRARGETPRD